MRRKTRHQIFAAITAAALLFSAGSFLAVQAKTAESASESAASDRRSVRVGMPDTDNVSSGSSENANVRFQKEYLQAVAEYAGWNYTYVEGSWNDLLEKLKAGTIDVLMDVSKTEERLAYYDYADEAMGTEMCYLFGRSDTVLNYDDFSSFDGIRIGYEDGSTIIDVLQEFAAARNFSFQAVPYVSGAAMFAALDAGEVDAVAQTNFFDTPAGHVILAKCSPNPVYIATTKKDPSLILELNTALAELFTYNPGFNTDLYDTYFGSAVSRVAGYTQKEQEYLSTKPIVNVYYEKNWAPFEYDQNGRASGITPDIIRAIGEDTGIEFRFVLTSSTQEVYQSMGSTTENSIMAVSYDYVWANSHDLLVTQPYVSGSAMRVTKNSSVVPKSVAIVKDGYLASLIAKEYPELTKVEFLTFDECMAAVTAGTADCTFLNYYQANYYRSMSRYENYSYQTAGNISQSIALGITTESNPLLFDILSKSLQRLSTSKVQSILSENSVQIEKVTAGLLVKRYPVQTAMIVAAVVILISLLIFLLILSGMRKRQNLALSQAIQKADEANQAKSSFLSRMSHDIRTPLNGIIGMTYLAREEESSPKTKEYLAKIDTSSKFLLDLINDILDLTKVENDKIELHPEPYPPHEFYDYIDAVIKPLCREKNQVFRITADLPEGCVPVIDKLRINQIVFNLLSNAVKYTPEGGTVAYDVVVTRIPASQKACMKITVSDSGIGMSQEFQQNLFQPFMQENRNDVSNSRGSGLGLAITKKLVELMGGTITVASELNKGSVFTVTVHVDYLMEDPASLAQKKTADSADVSLAGMHILVCEDHPLNQEIVRKLLEQKGAIVETADNGELGVQAFQRSAIGFYKVILMDIRMPVMNGYEAAEKIRSFARSDADTVPIIALTADAFTDDVQKCLAAGMNAHIAKPVDPNQMYQTIVQAVGR